MIDQVAAAPDALPSLWGAGIRLGLGVVVIAGAALGWLYWQRRNQGPGRTLEVIDRAFLARGVSVALLRVGERRLLIGVSTEGVRLLRDLENSGHDRNERNFSDVLADAAIGGELRR